jgi:hypothetical protein
MSRLLPLAVSPQAPLAMLPRASSPPLPRGSTWVVGHQDARELNTEEHHPTASGRRPPDCANALTTLNPVAHSADHNAGCRQPEEEGGPRPLAVKQPEWP